MQVIELALVLLLIVAVGGALVRLTRIPLPIFLVILGAGASLVPGLDGIDVDPEVFLVLFIPLCAAWMRRQGCRAIERLMG